MRRGYRLFFAVLGLGIASVAIATLAGQAARWADTPSPYPKYRETAEDAAKRLPMLSIGEALKASDEQRPCSNKLGHDASELCAQWRATDAAERASRWSWWQLFLSFFGVVGLGLTLWFNFEAWRQAKSSQNETGLALKHAEASAKAMQRMAKTLEGQFAIVLDGARTSKRIAETQDRAVRMQLRAYVSVLIGEAIFQDSRLNFQASPQILNSGPTPARNVRWRIAADVLPVPLPDEYRFKLPPKTAGGTIIGPGQNAFMSFVLNTRFSEDQIADIKAGKGQALYVWGYVIYEDILGKTHRTTFAQQLYWQQAGPQGEDGHTPEIIRGYYLQRHNCAN